MLKEYDYIIIGAGPSGLQLGYFLEKSGKNYLILEAGNSPGSFYKEFPRHRKLISINKIYTGYDDPEINLRWDWNSLLNDNEDLLFKHYSRNYFPSALDLVKYLEDFANSFNLRIKYGAKVVEVNKLDTFRVVDDQENIYACKYLIIATGLSKPYTPAIPGIELAENYANVSVNPEDFANQRVLIIGKGNSAFEVADNLVSTTSLIHVASPNPLSLAWTTKYVGHLRAVNNNFLDTYQLKSQNAILDGSITKINYQNDKFIVSIAYTHANEEQQDLTYDRVIVCTGFRFDDSVFNQSCRPELTINGRFPAQTCEWESINVKGMYFIGVLMHMRDYKKKQSGFIHGFRYNVRALHHILEQKYHNQKLPYKLIKYKPESLTKAIIKRVNRSSGLWQQTGFLCDLIIPSNQEGMAQYYEELPRDYIHESKLGQRDCYYTVSLEFGYDVDKIPNPFAINRSHPEDIDKASQSTFLHPIIRRFCRGSMICEQHLSEDLEANWTRSVHIKSLLMFFEKELAKLEQLQPVC